MLLWVYIYSAYVECNFGQFAYFIFFVCRREQKEKGGKKSTPEWRQMSYMLDPEVPQSNVSGMEVGGWEFTSAEN